MRPDTIIDDFCERAFEGSPLQGAQRAEARRELASHLYEKAAEIAGGTPDAAAIEVAIAHTDVAAFTHGAATLFAHGLPRPLAKAPRRRRLGAYLIDFVVVTLVAMIFAVPIVGPEVTVAGYQSHDLGDVECHGFFAFGVSFWAFSRAPVGTKTPCQEAAEASGILAGITGAVALLYFGVMEGRRGQSLGKMALGMRAVAEDGSPLSYGQAFGRNVVKGAWMFQLIDMFWWFGNNQQRLLERWSRTVVIDARKAGPEQSDP